MKCYCRIWDVCTLSIRKEAWHGIYGISNEIGQRVTAWAHPGSWSMWVNIYLIKHSFPFSRNSIVSVIALREHPAIFRYIPTDTLSFRLHIRGSSFLLRTCCCETAICYIYEHYIYWLLRWNSIFCFHNLLSCKQWLGFSNLQVNSTIFKINLQ